MTIRQSFKVASGALRLFNSQKITYAQLNKLVGKCHILGYCAAVKTVLVR